MTTMKKNSTPSPIPAQTPVFPKVMHELRPPAAVAPPGKGKKRDNIFSQSRDEHEDRGEREIKMSHNPQTNHGRK